MTVREKPDRISTKVLRARRRNWNKARLKGQFLLDESLLTHDERCLYNAIQLLVHTLLKDWDKNTEVLGFKVRKKDEVNS